MDTKKFDKVFGVASFIVALFFVRTALEDKTLRNEPAGYDEFCRKTRYRLVPALLGQPNFSSYRIR